jgi:nucleoside-diphosphate-sugar epimerase
VGGSGFLGSAVVKELVNNDVDVTVVVRSKNHAPRLDGLDINIVECDLNNILNLPDLISSRGYDVFYQLAWSGLAHEALTNYSLQILNIKWNMDCIESAAVLGCARFVGAGSISQYELGTLDGQISKHDKHRVYKTAKLTCQYMGRAISETKGLDFFWPIITNIYGPGEVSPRLVNTMIRNMLAEKRQPLSEGNQYYDFIYITDAASAFYLIGKNGINHKTYVIAGGEVRPLKEHLCMLRDVVAPYSELGFGELEFNGIYLPKELYDITPLREDTGFSPKISFAEGVRLTAEWIKHSN